MLEIKHGFYTPYFYWYFPIIVAGEENLFEKEGLKLDVKDIVKSGQPEDKAQWYLTALQEGVRNFYFCCTWQGVYSTSSTKKGKVVAAAPSTLIKTFGVYTTKTSGISSIFDLATKNGRIAVNKNADSHYVTLKNLREFIPDNQINLVHTGGVEACLRALLDKKVEAATLAGPYAEFADHIGLRKLLGLSRDEPSLVVMDDSVSNDTVGKFLRSINHGIKKIRENPEKYRELYYSQFESVIRGEFPELITNLDGFKDRMTIPVWSDLRPLSSAEFNKTKDFMVDTGLPIGDAEYSKLVNSKLET